MGISAGMEPCRRAVERHLEAGGGTVTTACVDFFDTLVTRRLEPEGVKILAARHLALALGCVLDGRDLYAMRRRIEAALCDESHRRGQDQEFSFADMALKLCGELLSLSGAARMHFSAPRCAEIMLAVEMAVEKELQRPCPGAEDFLRFLKKKGLRVVLLSDFYLPAACFAAFLTQHGLSGLVDAMYVSGDHKLGKHSGRLYERVMGELGCGPETMIMVGDNPHADIAMAESRGIAAFRLEPQGQVRQRVFPDTVHGDPARAGRRQDEVDCGRGEFAEMARVLWFFTADLFRRLAAQGTRDVFFLSKEGEFLQRLFDGFQETLFGAAVIRSHYLVVSRKSTYILGVDDLEREDFAKIFRQYPDISLLEFLQSLNFEEKNARALLAALCLDPSRRRRSLAVHEDYHFLRHSRIFEQAYKDLRAEQCRNFSVYLDSFGVNLKQDGMALVDVGWKGSIQDNLYRFLGGAVRMAGYYIGVLDPTDLACGNRKTGLLFSNFPQPSPFFDVFSSNCSLFEVLLGASHGSACRYTDGGDGFVQAAGLSAHRDLLLVAAAGGRKAGVVVEDLPEERALFAGRIKSLQEEMAAACQRFSAAFVGGGTGMPPLEWAARHHGRMVFLPRQEEVAFFAGLVHLENFGLFEFSRFAGTGGGGLRQTLSAAMSYFFDAEKIFSGSSLWPPIVLRQRGIGWLAGLDGRRRYQRAFAEEERL